MGLRESSDSLSEIKSKVRPKKNLQGPLPSIERGRMGVTTQYSSIPVDAESIYCKVFLILYIFGINCKIKGSQEEGSIELSESRHYVIS